LWIADSQEFRVAICLDASSGFVALSAGGFTSEQDLSDEEIGGLRDQSNVVHSSRADMEASYLQNVSFASWPRHGNFTGVPSSA
jgi:hypothetical protein